MSEKTEETENPNTIDLTLPKALERYDGATKAVWKTLMAFRIPFLANWYAKAPMLFNYMIVGASGTILSWVLYEGIFRPLAVLTMAPILGMGLSTLIGVTVNTLCIFMWNFIWNRKWSLNYKNQILKMTTKELYSARDFISEIIFEIEDKEGN
jgi:hypothetical protein